VSLFGDDGAVVAVWSAGAVYGCELYRSHDGELATVAVNDVITVVRLTDGQIVAKGPAGRGMAAAFPLDRRRTLEVAGELRLDRGFGGGHYGGSTGFVWADTTPRPTPAEIEAEIARRRARLVAAANVPMRRRLALRSDARVVPIHESESSPAEGGEAVLWPPIVGPAGVLLRHAFVTDSGLRDDLRSQLPWLVRDDGTVERLPFELGVSPLLAWPDGRWLLPGADPLWRDSYDEPLSLLDATGHVEPLLVGGRPVLASYVLAAVAPRVLAALGPIESSDDVAWNTVAARLDADADELLLVIVVDPDDDPETIVVAAVPLDGAAPVRLIAQIEPAPDVQIAVVP